MGADTASLAVVKVCLQSHDSFEHPATLARDAFLALGDRNSHIWTVVYTNHAMGTFRGVPDRTENTPTTGLVTKRCSCRQFHAEFKFLPCLSFAHLNTSS
jgi:hypothetical protein